ncbi:hypothetical protein [Geodermatophilus pulveris]|uniref:hypothetical protein n=1 Tax=Geodermatophilus pulveris TaxID=1564159 RepID=UPI000B785717|nr:hypothetical protein [Geodermatophilus pulveris]
MDSEEGVTEVFEDEVELDGPPAGQYKLLNVNLGLSVNPDHGLPVFLIETHKAVEKTWMQPLENAADEVAVAEQVKRQVQLAVE